MRRIRITLPATVTNLGPGLNGLGLAFALRTTVEMSARSDDQLVVEAAGEGAEEFTELRHPAVLALMRAFQHMEQALPGVHIRIDNQIPIDSGLGAEAAFTVAGVLGASNLLNRTYTRDDILAMAAQIMGRADGVVTSMLGGLAAGVLCDDESVIYRTFPAKEMQIVVVYPDIRGYEKKLDRALPKTVYLEDALYNLSRVPLIIDAFQQGDLSEVGKLMEDRLQTPALMKYISGYEEVIQAAQTAGAQAISISGEGPAVVAFSDKRHHSIAEAMRRAFKNKRVNARTWVLPIDRQGIVMSMSQSV